MFHCSVLVSLRRQTLFRRVCIVGVGYGLRYQDSCCLQYAIPLMLCISYEQFTYICSKQCRVFFISPYYGVNVTNNIVTSCCILQIYTCKVIVELMQSTYCRACKIMHCECETHWLVSVPVKAKSIINAHLGKHSNRCQLGKLHCAVQPSFLTDRQCSIFYGKPMEKTQIEIV